MTHRWTASLALAAAVGGLCLGPALAEGSASTAFVARSTDVEPGQTASFQVGVTSTDGTTWPAASVAVTVTVTDPNGVVVASSQPASPGSDVVPGQTSVATVDVPLPPQLAGALSARASIAHGGAVVGVTDPIGLAAATIAAAPPPARSGPVSGQIASNEIFAARSQQAGTISLTGTYGGGRSFQTNLGLSSTPGGQRPVATIQTGQTLTQIGTFAPSIDPLVMSGATGEGIAFKRLVGANTVQLATIAGGQATQNPFRIGAVSVAHATPGGWTISATAGEESVDGDPLAGLPFFLRQGTFAGVSFLHAPDARGWSYGMRYGIVSYVDGIANVRRSDSALEMLLGFPIRKSAWTFDLIQAGPYYPNLAAPGVTADKQTATLQGTIPVGRVTLTAGLNAYHDHLPGSPASAKTNFVTENLGASTAFANGDALTLNLSNAAQQRRADQSLASNNDTTSLTYTMQRRGTTYAFTVGSANQWDSFANMQHTVQDGVTVTHAFGPLTLTAGMNLTGNHASAATGTSLLRALVASATYVRGPVTFSSSLSRSATIPYLGAMPAPATALNYGVTFKPRGSTLGLNATMTQNYGAVSSSTSSLNLTRQF